MQLGYQNSDSWICRGIVFSQQTIGFCNTACKKVLEWVFTAGMLKITNKNAQK